MEESSESHRKDLTALQQALYLVMIINPFHPPYLNALKTRQLCAWKTRWRVTGKT